MKYFKSAALALCASLVTLPALAQYKHLADDENPPVGILEELEEVTPSLVQWSRVKLGPGYNPNDDTLWLYRMTWKPTIETECVVSFTANIANNDARIFPSPKGGLQPWMEQNPTCYEKVEIEPESRIR